MTTAIDSQDLLSLLKPDQREGSKPRCHLLTHGAPDTVASRLTALVALTEVTVSPRDTWLPRGFEVLDEAELGSEDKSILADARTRRALRHWWLAAKPDTARTPNWDIASTCTIQGKPGVLLVEAKAHDTELRNEERGKPLGNGRGESVSLGTRRNHLRIAYCIQDANLVLSEATNQPWTMSHEWNYQMANRFAWAWKLTELGISVVLAYLGFLGAEEMRRPAKNGIGQTPFSTPQDWESLVRNHSRSLAPPDIWNRPHRVTGKLLMPLIRSARQDLTTAS